MKEMSAELEQLKVNNFAIVPHLSLMRLFSGNAFSEYTVYYATMQHLPSYIQLSESIV